jgi:hypothetical protein
MKGARLRIHIFSRAIIIVRDKGRLNKNLT